MKKTVVFFLLLILLAAPICSSPQRKFSSFSLTSTHMFFPVEAVFLSFPHYFIVSKGSAEVLRLPQASKGAKPRNHNAQISHPPVQDLRCHRTQYQYWHADTGRPIERPSHWSFWYALCHKHVRGSTTASLCRRLLPTARFSQGHATPFRWLWRFQ